MVPIRIFISSVQKEFEKERAALRNHIREDPWMSQLFEVFLFEDTPASDLRPEALYLEEVARCDIYIGLFGTQYGFLDEEGVSPTEREFDRARELGKPRLVYLKKTRQEDRDPLMIKLIEKAQKDLVRKSFADVEGLKRAVSESLFKCWLDLFSGSAPADNECCRTSREAERFFDATREQSVGFTRIRGHWFHSIACWTGEKSHPKRFPG